MLLKVKVSQARLPLELPKHCSRAIRLTTSFTFPSLSQTLTGKEVSHIGSKKPLEDDL